jgi:hypothetical protein
MYIYLTKILLTMLSRLILGYFRVLYKIEKKEKKNLAAFSSELFQEVFLECQQSQFDCT